ncbi:Kelch-like protein 3 [Eumeta japonica]|uniref:Kelch-like protein 3 n=1 Tax=Eumeta variegata TaxID=151549 RepID=A0A4C1VG35_EUMVA|nr:Kelch-like protein 3 [Eumeta japonica]
MQTKTGYISLKSILSSESVANNFKIFRQDGTLCDVDLISGDTVVKAHRVVLAAACVYFETMFKSGLEECNRKCIPLPSIPPDVLSLVVEFIYSGQTMISGSTVIHLVDAANMLQLQELSAGCVEYLRKQLHPSNVVGIIRLAETHNLVQLAEEALSYAIKHWGAVADGEEFVHLSLTTLVKLLTSDELVIDSEVQADHKIRLRASRVSLRRAPHDIRPVCDLYLITASPAGGLAVVRPRPAVAQGALPGGPAADTPARDIGGGDAGGANKSTRPGYSKDPEYLQNCFVGVERAAAEYPSTVYRVLEYSLIFSAIDPRGG